LKFLDAAHIKDMLALLRFVEKSARPRCGFRLLASSARYRLGNRAARARSYG